MEAIAKFFTDITAATIPVEVMIVIAVAGMMFLYVSTRHASRLFKIADSELVYVKRTADARHDTVVDIAGQMSSLSKRLNELTSEYKVFYGFTEEFCDSISKFQGDMTTRVARLEGAVSATLPTDDNMVKSAKYQQLLNDYRKATEESRALLNKIVSIVNHFTSRSLSSIAQDNQDASKWPIVEAIEEAIAARPNECERKYDELKTVVDTVIAGAQVESDIEVSREVWDHPLMQAVYPHVNGLRDAIIAARKLGYNSDSSSLAGWLVSANSITHGRLVSTACTDGLKAVNEQLAVETLMKSRMPDGWTYWVMAYEESKERQRGSADYRTKPDGTVEESRLVAEDEGGSVSVDRILWVKSGRTLASIVDPSADVLCTQSDERGNPVESMLPKYWISLEEPMTEEAQAGFPDYRSTPLGTVQSSFTKTSEDGTKTVTWNNSIHETVESLDSDPQFVWCDRNGKPTDQALLNAKKVVDTAILNAATAKPKTPEPVAATEPAVAFKPRYWKNIHNTAENMKGIPDYRSTPEGGVEVSRMTAGVTWNTANFLTLDHMRLDGRTECDEHCNPIAPAAE